MKKLLLLLLLVCPLRPAANWYVRSTAACATQGNGTSPTCAVSPGGVGAWRGLANIAWPSVNAGDFVYLQGGDTYTDQALLTKSGSSGNPITISVNGAGTATIAIGGASAVAINTNGSSYIIVDGVRGNAYAGDTNYGLRVTGLGNGACIEGFGGEHDMKVFHVECAASGAGSGGDDQGGIRWQATSGTGHYEIAYNWIHGVVGSTTWHASGITLFTGINGNTTWDDTNVYQNRVEWMYHDGIKSNHNASLHDNYVSHVQDSLHSDSLQCQDAKYCQIYNNTVYDSGDQNIYVDTFSAFQSGPVRIYNNVTYSGAFSIVLHAENGSLGINDVVVANNTFYNMSSETIRKGGGSPSITGLVILNNIVATRATSGYQIDFNSGTITFNDANAFDYDVYQTPTSAGSFLVNDLTGCTGDGAAACTLVQLQALGTPREVHGKVGNPSFVNAGAGNFLLQSGDTVAKNSGRNLYSAYDFLRLDKAGNPRPSGGAWDIGAYSSTVPPPPTSPVMRRGGGFF